MLRDLSLKFFMFLFFCIFLSGRVYGMENKDDKDSNPHPTIQQKSLTHIDPDDIEIIKSQLQGVPEQLKSQALYIILWQAIFANNDSNTMTHNNPEDVDLKDIYQDVSNRLWENIIKKNNYDIDQINLYFKKQK